MSSSNISFTDCLIFGNNFSITDNDERQMSILNIRDIHIENTFLSFHCSYIYTPECHRYAEEFHGTFRLIHAPKHFT